MTLESELICVRNVKQSAPFLTIRVVIRMIRNVCRAGVPELSRAVVCSILAVFGVQYVHPIAARAQAAPEFSNSQRSSEPSADALFSAAKNTLANQTYPSHLDYSIVVRVRSGNTLREDHYQGSIEGDSNNFRVDQFSNEERATPSTPHGINVVLLLGKTGSRLVLSRRSAGEPMGIPNLSPVYSFGLRRCPTSKPVTADETIKTIGRVLSASRIYNVTSLGLDVVDGYELTHLSLMPIKNPDRNRLRDVWIDSSNVLVQARTSGNFTARETEHIPWIIRFKQIGSGSYIESESAEAPVKFLGRTYDAVTIEFSNIVSETQSGRNRFGRNLQFALPQDRSAGANLTEPTSADAC